MPQGAFESPWNYVQIGFIACAVMVILLLMLRDPREYPPVWRDYGRDYRVNRPGYLERRGPGRVLMLMLLAAGLVTIIAVLST